MSDCILIYLIYLEIKNQCLLSNKEGAKFFFSLFVYNIFFSSFSNFTFFII